MAVAAIKGEKTLIELAQDFDVHPNQIKQWRDQLLEGATGVFGKAPKAEPEPTIDVKTLHAKIGELTLEHKIYPYLLRKLPITRPNQVWAMDITYIPMACGFIYRVYLPRRRAGLVHPARPGMAGIDHVGG